MVPCLTSLARTDEGRAMLKGRPRVTGWRERMEHLDSVQRFRAAQPPRKPIEHARRWVTTHRPGILANFFVLYIKHDVGASYAAMKVSWPLRIGSGQHRMYCK